MNCQQRQDLDDCIADWAIFLVYILVAVFVSILLYIAYEEKVLTYLLVGIGVVVVPVPVCYYVKQWKRKIDSQRIRF